MVLPYRDRTILDDAANLLIHHVKRQTGIQKGEKRRIKHLLRQFLPDLFFHPRQQVSDDEREEDGEISLNYLLLQLELVFLLYFIFSEEKEDCDESPNSSPKYEKDSKSHGGLSPGKSPARGDISPADIKSDIEIKDEEVKVPLHAQTSDPVSNISYYVLE